MGCVVNAYQLGLSSGATVVHPWLQTQADRVLDVSSGFSMVRTGEGRFYKRGLGNTQVGAESPGVLGTLVDTAVGLILDVAHVLLLVGGMLLLWRGLAG